MENIQQLLTSGAKAYGNAIAVSHAQQSISYSELAQTVRCVANGLSALVAPQERIAIYLPKTLETVIASFACISAGAVLVPINPVLKSTQVQHIVNDSEATILITQASRLAALGDISKAMPSLQHIVLLDEEVTLGAITWSSLLDNKPLAPQLYASDSLCALLYTSGSTGLAKGVMLSHRNLLVGTQSVAEYLQLNSSDKILAALPLSFDYGFNQLLSSLYVGAQCVLLDYLLPRDIPLACARYGITGLAAVPPLWSRLVAVSWPEEAVASLRYFTNSGGHMSRQLLGQLRELMPKAEPVLMYGLTEAFRSSYLPPELIDSKPDSMGKAIPNARLYVLNDKGQECAVGEEGELVHAGSLVAQGYWRAAAKTVERFKPLPDHLDTSGAIAVWSGDKVYQDEDGYLFYKGRSDDQIKVSGYRVSPEEIEAALMSLPLVQELAAVGLSCGELGQQIGLALVVVDGEVYDEKQFVLQCRRQLASYMVPSRVKLFSTLPRNPNGKLDRPRILELLS